MLPANLGMIDQENIARMNVFKSVDLHAILHGYAKIGEEDRQCTFILRHRAAFVIDDADAVILYFVDHHVVGGLFQHGRHLIRGRFQGAADNLYGYGIDGHGFLSIWYSLEPSEGRLVSP